MGSASSNAWSIGRFLETYQGLQAILRTSDDHTDPVKTKITELSDRKPNKMRLVELLEPKSTQPNPRFILQSYILPGQLLDDVGCLLFVRAHTNIPVPRVYVWSTQPGQEYIAREYVEGELLSSVWGRYTEEEKEAVAVKIAKLIAEMVEIQFDGAGGILPDGKREHNVWKAPLLGFPTGHKAHRIALSKHAFHTSKPSVLCHPTLNGGNILVRGTDIVSVIDWGVAGAYRLSGCFNRGLDMVVGYAGDGSLQENLTWSRRILSLVGDMVREKGWRDEEIEELVGREQIK